MRHMGDMGWSFGAHGPRRTLTFTPSEVGALGGVG